MHNKVVNVVVLCATALAGPARADLSARVVDVGPGLCVVLQEGDHVVLYDAGHWQGGRCKAALDLVMGGVNAPQGNKSLELVVFSHSDGDHVGDGEAVLTSYAPVRVLHTGYRVGTSSGAYTKTLAAIAASGASEINLEKSSILPGATFQFGEMFVSFVAGWGEPPDEWGLKSNAHKNNAVSVVVRVTYAGKSILLSGDTYGRDIGSPAATCEAAEAVMVARSAAVPLRSDVLVAPHHGADNSSSACFVKAVKPDFVIFSAGHEYEHPTADAAQRYLSPTIGGVQLSHIFRTDRGDNEGGSEWSHLATTTADGRGDDDVLISISAAGVVDVKYEH